MVIEANYVDIEKRIIFPARVEIQEKKIFSITKIDKHLDSYILPGFVDAHIHIESSMLIPSEFARLAVVHGSVATVSDPHEIANVMGIDGVEFMLHNAQQTNFNFNFGVSPCVPATPFETSGAVLDAQSVKKLLAYPNLNHLAEVMAFPSVIAGDEEILQKIEYAKELNLPIDGHAPMLSGDDLQHYIDAGISTDHEASSYEEGEEKIQRGMKILIREGSAAKNYDALAPLIPLYADMLMFCSDDKHPDDLLKSHINALVIRSIEKGYDLFDVLKIASLNPIRHYNLDVGTLKLGDKADFIVVKDLNKFEILLNVINGEVVATEKESLLHSQNILPINNFDAQKVYEKDLKFDQNGQDIEVIQAIDHELFTLEKKYHTDKLTSFNGNVEDDILKIVVINRYKKTKPIVSFISGFGLKKGAIASSVAHDSHNIIAIGCDDESLVKAINQLISSQGGIVGVDQEHIEHLPLSVAGIMSHKDAYSVAKTYEEIDFFTKDTLGSVLSAPFMTLSFMALLVIPEIKISDKGLFDAKEFHFMHKS